MLAVYSAAGRVCPETSMLLACCKSPASCFIYPSQDCCIWQPLHGALAHATLVSLGQYLNAFLPCDMAQEAIVHTDSEADG